VIDVTSKETFDNLKMWQDEADRYSSENAHRVLLANKIDLLDKRVVASDQLQVCVTRQILFIYIAMSELQSYLA